MSTKFYLFIFLIVIVFSSCYTPKYLPKVSNIDENTSGSYIKVIRKSTANISGELIAVDSNKIIVLGESDDTCTTVQVSDIKRFKIRYARSKHYGWTVPLFVGLPLIHGLYSIFTIPVHLIVTIAVTATGENAYRYNNDDLPYADLRMFARFPQGIPSNIKIKDIKHFQ